MDYNPKEMASTATEAFFVGATFGGLAKTSDANETKANRNWLIWTGSYSLLVYKLDPGKGKWALLGSTFGWLSTKIMKKRIKDQTNKSIIDSQGIKT